MLPVVTATPDYYAQVIEAFPDTESLTVLVVAGASRDQVAAALSIDLSTPVDNDWSDNVELAAWALLDIPGGVLAVERSGYGDPARAALRTLSDDGRAAAVVRSNVQAHLRFGCARDGELLFDDDEYMYTDDPDQVPAELRPLFDLAWDDLESDDDSDEDVDGFGVGLAMAELVTGVEVTAAQVAEVFQSGFVGGPSLVYASSLDE
jgi:hypothetical protein